MALLALVSYADKLPKGVTKARQAVASVVTYKDGVMLHNGTAVFAGERGDVLSSRSLFVGADSAVVIDSKGVVRTVMNIVGVNEIFDCIKVRVAADKKLLPLMPSTAPVTAGETIYQLGYGVKKGGFAEPVNIERVDSAYSCAYYTLAKPMDLRYLSLPLVNDKGELVAMMQQAAVGDTVNSYAIGVSVASMLDVSVATFGKGYYPSMGIRTALPKNKEEALSCLYMQAIMGDSASYKSVIDDFIALYPGSYEGYMSRAEYEAVVLRDLDAAIHSWDLAMGLADSAAEVHYGKAKAMNAVLLQGDSVSHPALDFVNVLAEIDKAIAVGKQPLYMNAKAEMLFSHGDYIAAAECYALLADTDLRSADIFAKASQCYNAAGDYGNSVAMLDSAVNCFDSTMVNSYAPYILTRALVNATAKKYRDAVFDYNRYESLMGGTLGAEFYYLREQAELNAKMYQQALNDIDTAISLAPEQVAYYIEKGLLCYRVRLTDEGLRILKEADAVVPGLPDVHYLQGRLYMQKEDVENARIHLQKAVESGHPDAESVLKLLEK